mgnify:CR=1 FL=1
MLGKSDSNRRRRNASSAFPPKRAWLEVDLRVIAYVFFVALVNIALGFAAAVYLGARYRRLLAAELGDPGATDPGAVPTAVRRNSLGASTVPGDEPPETALAAPSAEVESPRATESADSQDSSLRLSAALLEIAGTSAVADAPSPTELVDVPADLHPAADDPGYEAAEGAAAAAERTEESALVPESSDIQLGGALPEAVPSALQAIESSSPDLPLDGANPTDGAAEEGGSPVPSVEPTAGLRLADPDVGEINGAERTSEQAEAVGAQPPDAPAATVASDATATAQADRAKPKHPEADHAEAGRAGTNASNSAETAPLDEAALGEDTSATPAGSGVSYLSDLSAAVAEYDARLLDVEVRLRTRVESSDAMGIQGCVDSLAEASTDYQSRRRDIEQSAGAADDDEQLREMRRRLLEAFEQQDRQIGASLAVLGSLEAAPDAVGAHRQVILETSRLIDANHQVRDVLETATGRFAAHRLIDPAADSGPTDDLTGLSDRVSAERQLDTWLDGDPRRVRQLSAVMVDIDQFAQINARLGHRVGDRMLRALGHYFEAECQGHHTASRFAGQRFLFLLPDTDLRAAANFAERLRQCVELSEFRHQDELIRLTVSCAATSASAQDTTDRLVARLETTVREAKRYGRNRTFIHDGTYPTPVVPPRFALEARHVDL